MGMLDETIRMQLSTAKAKGLSLRCSVGDDVPDQVVGDPTRLRQILLNLVSNAVKFTEHGEVELSVMVVNQSSDSWVLTFEVRDTGIGIDDSSLSTIFDSFSQADSSTTRRYGGSGLGLAICRKLVQTMMGEIYVQSEPGRGSIFRVIIPLGRTL
jgi:signal transduction histidine kinase